MGLYTQTSNLLLHLTTQRNPPTCGENGSAGNILFALYLSAPLALSLILCAHSVRFMPIAVVRHKIRIKMSSTYSTTLCTIVIKMKATQNSIAIYYYYYLPAYYHY